MNLQISLIETPLTTDELMRVLSTVTVAGFHIPPENVVVSYMFNREGERNLRKKMASDLMFYCGAEVAIAKTNVFKSRIFSIKKYRFSDNQMNIPGKLALFVNVKDSPSEQPDPALFESSVKEFVSFMNAKYYQPDLHYCFKVIMKEQRLVGGFLFFANSPKEDEKKTDYVRKLMVILDGHIFPNGLCVRANWLRKR